MRITRRELEQKEQVGLIKVTLDQPTFLILQWGCGLWVM